jgi:hypothetical protein
MKYVLHHLIALTSRLYFSCESKHMKKLMTTLSVAVVLGLACPVLSSAEEEKETTVNMSDVPAAVQQTFKQEAAGGRIVRIEKEENNYEVVIEKNGKQTGIEVNADGKVVSRHNEKKEHKEKGEKGDRD